MESLQKGLISFEKMLRVEFCSYYKNAGVEISQTSPSPMAKQPIVYSGMIQVSMLEFQLSPFFCPKVRVLNWDNIFRKKILEKSLGFDSFKSRFNRSN